MPGLVPKFGRTPGRLVHSGPDLGRDTDAVLADVLGYPAERIAALHDRGIV
jgi:formyl-CoA transferase